MDCTLLSSLSESDITVITFIFCLLWSLLHILFNLYRLSYNYILFIQFYHVYIRYCWFVLTKIDGLIPFNGVSSYNYPFFVRLSFPYCIVASIVYCLYASCLFTIGIGSCIMYYLSILADIMFELTVLFFIMSLFH